MKSRTEILGGCQMAFGISHDIQEIFEGYVTIKHRRLIQMLASVDGNKVAARNKTMLLTAFHPELTANLQILQYFLAKVV